MQNIEAPLNSFSQKFESGKKVDIYYITFRDRHARPSFAYVAVNSLMHEQFMCCLKDSVIPDYAVVVESGFDEPNDEIKAKIKQYYGFDHDLHLYAKPTDSSGASGGSVAADA